MDKIRQILLYEDSFKEKNIIKEYTIEKLNKLIVPTSQINESCFTEDEYLAFMKKETLYSDDINSYYEKIRSYHQKANIPYDETLKKEEKWKRYPDLNKEYQSEYLVSNFGRIKRNGKILALKTLTTIYDLVARTWLKIEENGYWHIHHISNDIFDNRPENLIWIKKEDHYKINHKTNI